MTLEIKGTQYLGFIFTIYQTASYEKESEPRARVTRLGTRYQEGSTSACASAQTDQGPSWPHVIQGQVTARTPAKLL